MAAAEEAEGAGGPGAAELSQALSRPLSVLQQPDCGRAARLRALEAIGAELRGRSTAGAALREVFVARLLRPLSRCAVGDAAERCREQALQLLRHGLSQGAPPCEALPVLLPALAQRLCPPPGAEHSEELRLGLVQLLRLLLQRCGPAAAPYLGDIARVLQATLLDHYAEVRRESCRCAVDCAQAVPEHFHMQSESLIKPLMQTISHQHYRVRVDVIQATGAVIQFGNGKSVDDVLSHLAQRLFDEIPKVRHAVTTVIGEWLLHLRDRYSYFHKLIPLLLGSFSDEIPENTELAWTYWEKIGLQWEKENEEDLKDKMDFSVSPSHYPKGVTRPGLGCRELVSRNLSKILPGLCRDLTDWVVSTRVKASQLLYTLLLHAEDHITQHMELLLRTLYQSCLDEESDVVKNSVKAAELIGTFVSPKVSLRLITSAFGQTPKPSCVMVLAAVIRGSPKEILQPHVAQLGNTLSQPGVCQRSEEVFYMEQLLCCVRALIDVCQEDCKEISFQLMKVLVTIMAIPSSQDLKEKLLTILKLQSELYSLQEAKKYLLKQLKNIQYKSITTAVQVEKTMSSLAEVQQLDSFHCLYKQHITELLEWVSVSCDGWTCYSPEVLQLEVIATHSGPVVGEALKEFILILKTCLQPNKDPQMRLKLFTVLSQLFQKASETINSQGLFPSYLETVIKDILAPNLQWHAGRTAAAIRATAVLCLWALIHCEMLSPKEILKVKDELMPQIIASMDEDSKITRLMACRIVDTFLKACGKQFDEDKFKNTYTEVLKRLDDASCDVRLAAAHTLANWFKCLKDSDVKSTMEGHVEFLYQELLIHLDDPDQNLQNAVLEVLKEGSVLYPDLLVREIEGVVHKHQTPVYCNQLLHHIQSAKESAL